MSDPKEFIIVKNWIKKYIEYSCEMSIPIVILTPDANKDDDFELDFNNLSDENYIDASYIWCRKCNSDIEFANDGSIPIKYIVEHAKSHIKDDKK
jgi:hypothetical protein